MLNQQVYADIFGRSPELTRMMRSLTTETRKFSELPFLYQQCYKSPTIKELSNYIDTLPNKIATFTFIYNNDTIAYELLVKFLYDVPWFHHKTMTHNLYIFKLETDTEYYQEEGEEPTWRKILDYLENAAARTEYELSSELNEFKEKFLNLDNGDKQHNMFFEVDVLTYYNILNRREQCIKINQSFKNATKDYFTKTLEFINSLPYSIHMYDAYLTINGYILNVDIPNKIKESIVLDEFSNTKDEDDEVIELYNKYIEETNDLRQKVINDILTKISEF